MPRVPAIVDRMIVQLYLMTIAIVLHVTSFFHRLVIIVRVNIEVLVFVNRSDNGVIAI